MISSISQYVIITKWKKCTVNVLVTYPWILNHICVGEVTTVLYRVRRLFRPVGPTGNQHDYILHIQRTATSFQQTGPLIQQSSGFHAERFREASYPMGLPSMEIIWREDQSKLFMTGFRNIQVPCLVLL